MLEACEIVHGGSAVAIVPAIVQALQFVCILGLLSLLALLLRVRAS